MNELATKWPKRLPELTDEQQRIRDDFMNHWLQILPKRYGILERFNHSYPLRTQHSKIKRTLDIGAGRGEHLNYEDISSQDYTAMELRPELAEVIRLAYPSVKVVVGDCQERIDFPDNYFDRVLAIHILEHLPNLPKALDEIKRILMPNGLFSVVIPCEGGLAYSLARQISTRRIFEKRYQQKFDWLVACEHINQPDEIISELRSRFKIIHRSFFPLVIPSVNLNLVIGLTLVNPD